MRRLVSAIAGCLLCGLLWAQPVYRWVDGDGNVQYSDRPPPDSAATTQEIEIHAGIGAQREAEARLRLAEQERRLQGNREIRSQIAAEAASGQIERDKMNQARAQLCRQARRNLQTLIDQGPVYSMNDAGERVFLEDSQRDTEITRYRQVVAQACQ